MANVGGNIKRARQSLGISQAELAVLMGYPRDRQGYVSDVERGVYIPDLPNLLKFAAALAVDIQQLVSDLEQVDAQVPA